MDQFSACDGARLARFPVLVALTLGSTYLGKCSGERTGRVLVRMNWMSKRTSFEQDDVQQRSVELVVKPEERQTQHEFAITKASDL